jgi:hypothetical protein
LPVNGESYLSSFLPENLSYALIDCDHVAIDVTTRFVSQIENAMQAGLEQNTRLMIIKSVRNFYFDNLVMVDGFVVPGGDNDDYPAGKTSSGTAKNS